MRQQTGIVPQGLTRLEAPLARKSPTRKPLVEPLSFHVDGDVMAREANIGALQTSPIPKVARKPITVSPSKSGLENGMMGLQVNSPEAGGAFDPKRGTYLPYGGFDSVIDQYYTEGDTSEIRIPSPSQIAKSERQATISYETSPATPYAVNLEQKMTDNRTQGRTSTEPHHRQMAVAGDEYKGVSEGAAFTRPLPDDQTRSDDYQSHNLGYVQVPNHAIQQHDYAVEPRGHAQQAMYGYHDALPYGNNSGLAYRSQSPQINDSQRRVRQDQAYSAPSPQNRNNTMPREREHDYVPQGRPEFDSRMMSNQRRPTPPQQQYPSRGPQQSDARDQYSRGPEPTRGQYHDVPGQMQGPGRAYPPSKQPYPVDDRTNGHGPQQRLARPGQETYSGDPRTRTNDQGYGQRGPEFRGPPTGAGRDEMRHQTEAHYATRPLPRQPGGPANGVPFNDREYGDSQRQQINYDQRMQQPPIMNQGRQNNGMHPPIQSISTQAPRQLVSPLEMSPAERHTGASQGQMRAQQGPKLQGRGPAHSSAGPPRGSSPHLIGATIPGAQSVHQYPPRGPSPQVQRPGQLQIMQQNQRPMQSNPPGPPVENASDMQLVQETSGLINLQELNSLRAEASQTGNPKIQLTLVKRLIEAATVLADDAGRADPKTARRNRENFANEAYHILKRLATPNERATAYPEAMFFLANCYGNGALGLEVDHEKAFNLYEAAGKQGHAASCYRTAVCLEIGAGVRQDLPRAVRYYDKAATHGDAAAMYKIGMILLRGLLGQRPDQRNAITWLQKAAENADIDNPHALHELALLYEKGDAPSGIIQNEQFAKELFTKAAKLHYVPSQFRLGYAYEYGTLGCPVDPRRSIAWFSRGAERGDPECELSLSGWYLTGSEDTLVQNDREAYLWGRKAAEKGLAKAEFAVGYFYETGIGTTADIEEAKKWYKRAAAQGQTKAQDRLLAMKEVKGKKPVANGSQTRQARPMK